MELCGPITYFRIQTFVGAWQHWQTSSSAKIALTLAQLVHMSLWTYKRAIWLRRACPMAHLCQDFSPIVALKDHSAVADEARIPSMMQGYLRCSLKNIQVLNAFSSNWHWPIAQDKISLHFYCIWWSSQSPQSSMWTSQDIIKMSLKGKFFYRYAKIKSTKECCVIKLAQQT